MFKHNINNHHGASKSADRARRVPATAGTGVRRVAAPAVNNPSTAVDTARRPRRALSQTQPARTRGEAQPQVRGTCAVRYSIAILSVCARTCLSSVATEWHVRRGNVPMAVRKWRFIPIPKSPLHQGDRVRLQQLVCGSHCPWYQSWRKCRESAHCRACFLARASGSRMGPTCRVAPIPTWRQHR